MEKSEGVVPDSGATRGQDATTAQLNETIARLESELADANTRILSLEHQRLVSRDYIIGLEAEIARIKFDHKHEIYLVSLALQEHANNVQEAVVTERERIQNSHTWQLGRTAMLPVRAGKLVTRKLKPTT